MPEDDDEFKKWGKGTHYVDSAGWDDDENATTCLGLLKMVVSAIIISVMLISYLFVVVVETIRGL